MHHARPHARHRTHREPDPVVRRVDSATLALGVVCTWIYVGLLTVDGERLAGPLSWLFAAILAAIVAARLGTRLVRRRRLRAPHGKS